jgi:sirohydrochlorin ferrochelatase
MFSWGPKMPAGKALIENVARALDPNIGMSAAEIAFHLPDPKPSNRAIRYAVKALVAG